jgi:hypothetical protein
MLLTFLPRPAQAQDPFEIQVYDSDTAPRLSSGLELHINYFADGTSSIGPGAVLPSDRVLHLTFEPHLGVADWAELGGYLQTAVRPDGSYDYAGVKVRFKARLPRRVAGRLGLALNTEISAIPRVYSESRFGLELRPILDLRVDHFYFSVNPILDFELEGDVAGWPQLEPALKAESLFLRNHLGLGVEYYSALGPVRALRDLSRQVHRVFGILDLMQLSSGKVRLGLNLGVGYGLAAGEKWIIKSILAITPCQPRRASPSTGRM